MDISFYKVYYYHVGSLLILKSMTKLLNENCNLALTPAYKGSCLYLAIDGHLKGEILWILSCKLRRLAILE